MANKKIYGPASDDVIDRIARLRETYYAEALEEVTVGALFSFGTEDEPVLTHHGYPAAAVCRIVPARDRAAGLPDAQIIVDRYVWSALATRAKDALLDHELMHIDPQFDSSGAPKYDAQGRPVLKIRKHDRHFGWFDVIAQRHGRHSTEVRQATALIDATAQLYFDFGTRNAA